MPLIPNSLLCYCPASIGGIAQYCHEQSKALSSLGISVTTLCPSDYPYQEEGYSQIRRLTPKGTKRESRLVNQAEIAYGLLEDARVLDKIISAKKFNRVLFASYSEYLAPLWAWRLRRQQASGVKFAAVVHDPVRNYIIGPEWWHNRSVREGYSFLDQVYLHEPVSLEFEPSGRDLKKSVIPHGPFPAIPAKLSKSVAREKYSLPPEATVLISFGYIRDNKNLNLAIESLASLPNCHLLVAGRESTDCQRPVSFYRDLAASRGVGKQCHWINRFIEPAEIGDLFIASDYALLTYSRAFRSASGVLSTAVSYRIPCVASGGQSSLKSSILEYKLGTWVEADNLGALIEGVNASISNPPSPQWDRYFDEHSWRTNARIIIETFLN
ncbi:MAG: glycosyltransferase family 4 protein [Verrucomicrobiales bacterium]